MTAALLLAALVALSPYNENRLAVSCGTCHPLDPVYAARFSRPEWDRELDKMASMGAVIKSRKELLDYLAAHYGKRKSPVRGAAAGVAAIPATRAR